MRIEKLFPTGINGFRMVSENGISRELNPEDSRDRAQIRFDELVELAFNCNVPVKFNSTVEDKSQKIATQELVPLQSSTANSRKEGSRKISPNKLRQQSNLNGFTGFWRGRFYRGGVT